MVVPPPAPDTCTQVSPDCPVEGTILGYYPDIGANAAYAGFFALAALINLGLGLRYKTWSYMVSACPHSLTHTNMTNSIKL